MTAIPSRWEKLRQAQRLTPLAVVSVDDDAVRRDIQLDMPRTILNAGTGDYGEYRVSRHDFLTGACLSCISRADKRFNGPEQALAARLGLPLEDLAPHLHNRMPLPDARLAQAAVSDNERTELAGIPGRDLLQHLCGSLALGDDGPAVSAPMISAAAGVLLAAELAKHPMTNRIALRNGQAAFANILIGPHTRWAASRQKRPECSCQDPLYANHYQTTWHKRRA
jgi:hypothetical protein